jgi:hypothetical protein
LLTISSGGYSRDLEEQNGAEIMRIKTSSNCNIHDDERRSSSLELPRCYYEDVDNTTNIIQAKYNEFFSPSMRGLAALLICATAIVIGGATFLSSWETHNSSDAAAASTTASNGNSVTADNNEHHNLIQSDSNSIQQQRSIIQKTNPQSRDLFLLSGQSNMIGHTTSSQSIGGNSNYWDEIKSILESNKDDNKFEELYNIIYETNYQNKQVAQSLTSGMKDLYQSSLLNDLDTPMQYGKCSFQYAKDDTRILDVSSGTVPISLDANCGSKFGHEFTFGRTLELELKYDNEYELHKVARGGSGLYEHWFPGHGKHWHLLKETIEERNDDDSNWKGFVWHQGSQAAWSERQYGEDRSLTYLGNLTGLVDEVRTLMFDNSKMWQCKEEIPVVIVQVGFWPENDAARRVRDAQAKFCDEDPRAVLVKTDDLSRFYHYDAVSFLITGRRIAYAYKEALERVGVCPGGASFGVGVATTFPTVAPTKQSTTSEPSVAPTNEPVQLTTFPTSAQASAAPTSKPTSAVVATPVTGNTSNSWCDDNNAKIFKLNLRTAGSLSTSISNTSWILYDESENVIESSSNILYETGKEYTKRMCITPNSYKFVMKDIDGCYQGYMKGDIIFDACSGGGGGEELTHYFSLEDEPV